MVSCVLLILGPLWIHILTQTCRGEELPRDEVLSWFTHRLLEGLGVEEPPPAAGQPGARRGPRRAPRTSRTVQVNHQNSRNQETSEMILFPSSDPPCARSDLVLGETTNNHLTYCFKPSVNNRETLVSSAHFWFYAGEGTTANSSAQLFIITSEQQLLRAAEAPSTLSPDGWTTYQLDRSLLASAAEGPFLLQVRCPACESHAGEPDKTPFLHLHVLPRARARSPRHAPVTVPWSPSALDLFQRPGQEAAQHSDCHRAEIEISFEELGWDNWIVHPKALTFYYCHGNCSAWDRITTMLGIAQCCAPVPGTMKSLRITTTSDSGYSFKYETLPNIMPEECTCI